MTAPGFREIYGDALADRIDAITASPEQQRAAAAKAAELADESRRQEARLLKEICDGADNKVYGKAGQDIASRFPAEVDGHRSYYMQVGLREALLRAGLLKRSGRKGR